MEGNLRTLVDKVKIHVRDTHASETDIGIMVIQVIEDIANRTDLFKKMQGFTVHSDKDSYDFNAMMNMNERVEEELTAVTIEPLDNADLLKFLATGVFQDPTVDQDTFIEVTAMSEFIKTLAIYDETGRSVSEMFQYQGSSIYMVHDPEWLKQNDNKNFAYLAIVKPDIDELLPTDINTITSTVIQGCKFYFNDTMQSSTDAQVANLYYQRYFNAMQALQDRFPTKVFGYKSTVVRNQWL